MSKDPVSGEEAISLISKLETTLANDVVYHAHVQTRRFFSWVNMP